MSRKIGHVWVPKAGWIRFRWSRAVPTDVKSYRMTLDRAGRWHVAFAAIPAPVPAPGNGRTVGIDRGVKVAAALSTGDRLQVPGLTWREKTKLRRLERKLARAKRGSARREQVRLGIAQLRARETDRRKDWAEKTTTNIARRFDLIRVEDLKIKNMTRSAKGTREKPGRNVRQKSGLNRGILRSGWGLLERRLEHKAPAGWRRLIPRSRASGARRAGTWTRSRARAKRVFRCTACGYICHADVNAAIEHRGGARRDCAGRIPECRACEPRTSTAYLLPRV